MKLTINEKKQLLIGICKKIITPGYTYNVRKSDYSDDTFYVEFSNRTNMSRYRISEHKDRSGRTTLITRINKGSKAPIEQFLEKRLRGFKSKCVVEIIERGKNESRD